jgi:hypothetical protein
LLEKEWSELLRDLYRIAGAVALVALLVALSTSLVLGGCDTLIPADSGAFPMKCHWAFIAVAVVLVIGIAVVLAQLLLKTTEARRFAASILLLIALAAAFLPSPLGIGICSDGGMMSDGTAMLCAVDGMDCHTTAPVVWVCATVIALCAVAQLAKADPEGAKKPKLTDGPMG